MNKRLGFIAIASALAFGVGCDDGGDTDGGMCPEGMICLDGGGDGGTDDAGPMADAGPPPPCNSVGRSGGLCRMGTQCITGLTCMGELSIMGMPLTLGNVFNIQDGMLDMMAAYPEYTPTGPSPVRVSVTPGGLCSEGCSTEAMADTCGECSFCNEDIGGSSSFGAVGISIRTFDVANPPVIGAGEDGICRGRCNFDGGMTTGGCPMGHTCDRFTNTCLESCISDDQCNLSWGDSEEEGLVAIRLEGNPYTCNTTNGLCEWTAPPGAAYGSVCETSADCAAGVGLCYFGRCTETNCSDSSGMMAGPGSCPMDAAACFGSGGNNSSFCLGLCNTAADCPDEHSCSPLMNPIMDAMGTSFPGVCAGPCEDNTEVGMNRRCDNTVQRFSDETLGVSQAFCVPPMGAPIMGSITCDAMLGEICEPVAGEAYGFCKSQNRLCGSNETCNGDQRCRHIGPNGLGRCEDSCMVNADCNVMAMEECVVVDTDPDDTFTENRGVCIAPGGICSPSPTNQAGNAISLLKGIDGSVNCVAAEECISMPDENGDPVPGADGLCTPRP